MTLRQTLAADLLALGVLAGTLFLGACLVSFHPADPPAATIYPAHSTPTNIAGLWGAHIAHAVLQLLGLAAFVLVALLAIWDIRLFAREACPDPLVRAIGVLMVMGAAAIGLHGLPVIGLWTPPVGNGGLVGAWGHILLEKHFTPVGQGILVASIALAGLVLAQELRLLHLFVLTLLLPFTIWNRLAFGPRHSGVRRGSQGADPANRTEVASNGHVDATAVDPLAVVVGPSVAPVELPGAPAASRAVSGAAASKAVAVVEAPATVAAAIAPPKINPPQVLLTRSAEERSSEAAALVESPQPARLPTDSLLEDSEEFPYEVLAQRAQQAAVTLEKTFQEFGLNVRVVEIDTGPVVTQFELELEAGLRLSKVTALADDLAIALRVPAVRVVAPIPGKNTVGVEVPNDVRVMVRLKELLQSCQADFKDKRIPLFLGKDVSGRPLVVDMAKMPHLLIAGRTGTGKSVCLNTLILSILMSRTPDQVQMLMIDPKMVELSPYMRIPHLMHPVITDMKKAEAVLGWAVDKMEERYDLLARVGVRHLDSYNKLGKSTVLERLGLDPDSEEAAGVPETMPYIVIIADEMADMIMTSGKDVEGYIIRLAQKSRAVGIHLVLATQKPTVDVITGLIKSNLPARISFQVSSRVDSRVVLDELGADKLLGNGDMLYLAPGTSNLTRAQGTFVSDEEVMNVIEFYRDQPPRYSAEIAEVTRAAKAGGKAAAAEPRDRDDLYDQAVEIVIREGRGSVSLLQRALGVGYGRGARMIDWMAEDGVVGTYNGSQAREVLMSLEEWHSSRGVPVPA
jgi:DNA segregation ATPase FtsK/SpoIIIE, S-DNA-T family